MIMLLRRYKGIMVTVFMLMVFLGYTVSTYAISMQVAPHRFVFSIDQSNTQEAVVTNVSDHPVKIKVYCEPAPDQLKEEYLGDWVVIFPKLLTLNPGEKKTVRFSVRTPKGLKDGEYRAFLFFEEMFEKKEATEPIDNVQLDFQLLTKLGVNIYGQTGKIVRQGQLRNPKVEYLEGKINFKGEFINQGNAHILADVNVQILNEKQQVVKNENITSFAIHRSGSEVFDYKADIKENGKYTLKLSFKHENQVVYSYSTTFEVSNGKLKN